jgi:hypothetical protein
MDLLLGVPPNSLQEATATSLADYFQDPADATPFSALPQQVPLATNPTAAKATTPGLQAAAERQKDVPPGLDKGGQALQDALRLRHEGAAQAGEPGIPVLADAVEHTLHAGDPASVSCSAAPAAPAAAAPGRLAATGGRSPLPIALVLLGGVALLALWRRTVPR